MEVPEWGAIVQCHIDQIYKKMMRRKRLRVPEERRFRPIRESLSPVSDCDTVVSSPISPSTYPPPSEISYTDFPVQSRNLPQESTGSRSTKPNIFHQARDNDIGHKTYLIQGQPTNRSSHGFTESRIGNVRHRTKEVERRSTECRAVERRSTECRAVERKSTECRVVERKSTESRAVERKSTECRAVERKSKNYCVPVIESRNMKLLVSEIEVNNIHRERVQPLAENSRFLCDELPSETVKERRRKYMYDQYSSKENRREETEHEGRFIVQRRKQWTVTAKGRGYRNIYPREVTSVTDWNDCESMTSSHGIEWGNLNSCEALENRSQNYYKNTVNRSQKYYTQSQREINERQAVDRIFNQYEKEHSCAHDTRSEKVKLGTSVDSVRLKNKTFTVTREDSRTLNKQTRRDSLESRGPTTCGHCDFPCWSNKTYSLGRRDRYTDISGIKEGKLNVTSPVHCIHNDVDMNITDSFHRDNFHSYISKIIRGEIENAPVCASRSFDSHRNLDCNLDTINPEVLATDSSVKVRNWLLGVGMAVESPTASESPNTSRGRGGQVDNTGNTQGGLDQEGLSKSFLHKPEQPTNTSERDSKDSGYLSNTALYPGAEIILAGSETFRQGPVKQGHAEPDVIIVEDPAPLKQVPARDKVLECPPVCNAAHQDGDNGSVLSYCSGPIGSRDPVNDSENRAAESDADSVDSFASGFCNTARSPGKRRDSNRKGQPKAGRRRENRSVIYGYKKKKKHRSEKGGSSTGESHRIKGGKTVEQTDKLLTVSQKHRMKRKISEQDGNSKKKFLCDKSKKESSGAVLGDNWKPKAENYGRFARKLSGKVLNSKANLIEGNCQVDSDPLRELSDMEENANCINIAEMEKLMPSYQGARNSDRLLHVQKLNSGSMVGSLFGPPRHVGGVWKSIVSEKPPR